MAKGKTHQVYMGVDVTAINDSLSGRTTRRPKAKAGGRATKGQMPPQLRKAMNARRRASRK